MIFIHTCSVLTAGKPTTGKNGINKIMILFSLMIYFNIFLAFRNLHAVMNFQNLLFLNLHFLNLPDFVMNLALYSFSANVVMCNKTFTNSTSFDWQL